MRVNLDNLVLDDDEELSENFATLFEASQRDDSGSVIKEAAIVKITDENVMVDVGEKVEGRFPLEEILDESRQPLFKEGDRIKVSVSKGFGERFSVSYKKALRLEKIQALGDNYKDKVISARIIGKNKGGVILESDGVEYFMPKFHALSKEDKGKVVDVCIINVKPDQHSIIVSRKRFFELNHKNQSENAKKIMELGGALDGVVKRLTNFGMYVAVGDVEGLVHYTEITHRGPVNPAKFYKEGDCVKVKAIAYDESKGRLSLSVKALQEDPWKEVASKLKVGYAIKVNVSNIEPYGAFVDIGNDLEGFLHVSEISWNKDLKHPEEVLSVGQEIDVEVIEIDSQSRRLRVSLKKLLDKPFSKFLKSHKEGDILEGKIATITDFGAFVDLGNIDGLLRNEDAFWEKGKRCKDEFRVGDQLKVKLIKIDSKNERLSLSLKALKESPVDLFARTHRFDGMIEGAVVDIKDFGVFINVDGVDVLIRNEDLSGVSKEELSKGMVLKAAVVAVDKANAKVRASMKRLEHQKEREGIKNFNSDEKMTLGDKLKGRL